MGASLFWLFVPDEALPLLVVVSGLLVMLGFRQIGLTLLLGVLLLPLLGPFIEVLVSAIPPWLVIALAALLILGVLRGIAGLLIGRGAADVLVGELAADVVRFSISVFILGPLRLARHLVAILFGGLNGILRR